MAEIGDIYEVRWVSLHLDQIGVNVRHFRVSTKAGTGATDADIASAMGTLCGASYRAVMAAAASYRGVGVRRIRPLPISLETSSTVGAGAGSVAGDCLPDQTAGIGVLMTGFGGRSRRGRMYVPFPAEGDSGPDGKPTLTYSTNLGLLMSKFVTPVACGTAPNTNDLVPIVWSKKLQTSTDVLTTTVRFVWGTQRSRSGFGRKNVAPF